MAVFNYKAIDLDATVVQGTIAADTPRSARDLLRARGLTIQDVQPVHRHRHLPLWGWLRGDRGSTNGATASSRRDHPRNDATSQSGVAADAPSDFTHPRQDDGFTANVQGQSDSRAGHFRGRRRGANRHLVVGLVRELATLLGVGIPLLEALDTLARQHRGRFQAAILQLRDRVASGSSLTEAMREQDHLFDTFCIHLVEVGEHAGNLDQTLEQLADFMERSAQLKGRIVTALLYPAMVLCMSLGVTLFLMTYVVPKLLDGLVDAGRPIPLATRVVMNASGFLIGYWWLLVTGGGIVVVVVTAVLQTWRGRLAWHRIQLKLPLLGDLIRKQHIARIAIVMATLLRSGIVFVKAVQVAQQTTSNLAIRGALAQCETAVIAGRDVSAALERTDTFPPTVVQIFSVGEQSGRLEDMLDRLAVDYDRQVATAAQRFTTVLEPLLILVMVLLVGLIAFATVMPMLEAGNVL